MAPRSRAATVAERPNTSSGPSSKPFDKPSFDKRVSRDDLTLALKSYGKGNVKAYHIPVRGQLPSPETSPQGESLTRATVVRTSTPESLGEGDSGVVAIGMALGSPTQAPGFTPPAYTRTMTAAAFEIPEPTEDVQSKPKTRKWGLFGRSKSKRGRPEGLPQRSMTDASHTPNTSVSSGAGSIQKTGGQGDQDPRKTPKHRPIVIRSETEPIMVQQPEHKDSKSSKDLSRKSSTRSIRGESSKSKKIERPPPSPIPPVPQLALLDVKIPDIKMERYSVMFGNVLQQPQPASSLLARRQATLDRLKTINDQIAKEGLEEELPRPRRATSPQPKNSPTFSLFPTTPGGSRASVIQKPSPRLRSNTSPAMLPSPAKATFDEEQTPQKETLKAKVVHIGKGKEPQREIKLSLPANPRPTTQLVSKFNKQPTPKQSTPKHPVLKQQDLKQPSVKPSPNKLSPSMQASPSMQPSPFTPDTSSLILDSPVSTDGELTEVHILERLKPTVAEPSWQMVSPPASTASSSPNLARKATPPSSVTSPDPSNSKASPAMKKPAEVDADEALSNAVQISIARQISVSQQQRKMLRPLQDSINRKKKNNESSTPRSATEPTLPIAVGENERLVETKTATPTLVNPEDASEAQRPFKMHRKSSWAVVEGGP